MRFNNLSYNKIIDTIARIGNIATSYGMYTSFVVCIQPHLTRTTRTKQYLLHKHNVIQASLEKKYEYVVQRYCRVEDNSQPDQSSPIWFFWWQGRDQMPDIVRICYESILRHAPSDRQVIFVSRENYNKFAQIPTFLLDKVETGNSWIVAFSDFLRVCLIYEHGGLWLDATVFVSNTISEDTFSPFFSVNHDPTPYYSSDGRWTGFILGGNRGSPLFKFLRDFYIEYWRNEKFIIDYFLLDYLISIAYSRLPFARNLIDGNPFRSRQFKSLNALLNSPFDERAYGKVISAAIFHKLSWKIELKKSLEDGRKTFFGILLSIYGKRVV